MKKSFKNFQMRPTTKGVRVNAEQRVKPQSARAGVLATLRVIFRGKGSSAPAHRRIPRLGFVIGVTAIACLLIAGPAAAESPWWHLTSGTRPATIDPGSGQNEVQEVTVSATGGEFILYEPNFKEAEEAFHFPWNALPSEVQTELVAFFGAGNVEVTGGPGDETGSAPYVITFTGELAGQTLETLSGELSEGHLTCAGAGPACTATSKVIDVSKGRPDGEIYLTVQDIGDQSLSGAVSPVQIVDHLPAGLEAVEIGATKPELGGEIVNRLPVPCEKATLTCTFTSGLAPFDTLEVRIGVNVRAAAQSGELNEVAVSGGEGFTCQTLAPPAGEFRGNGCMIAEPGGGFERLTTGPVAATSLRRPVVLGTEPVPFGIENYELRNEEEGGSVSSRAASHPFQSTTTIALNQGRDARPVTALKPGVNPIGLPKDLHFNWPPGLIGNPTPFPTCTDAQFFTSIESGGANACPPASTVGVATAVVNEPSFAGVAQLDVPIFNMQPRYGEPARFGFNVIYANAPVVIDTSLRSGVGGDYGIDVETNNITQTAAFLSSVVTVWGTPGDPRHNHQRGWACLQESRGTAAQAPLLPCSATATAPESHPAPFLSTPTSCQAGQRTSVEADPWSAIGAFRTFTGAFSPSTFEACNQVPFAPTIEAEPTSDAATSPTGLSFDIDVEDAGLANSEGRVQSQLKKAVVTLPQGFTTNPSVAEGLHACPQGDYEHSTVDGSVGCPEDSKIGDVEIQSPLVTQTIHGSLFVARQGENPNQNNLLTIYMVARNPEIGVIIKQALKVVPNPLTGQLTTEVDNVPQLPFSHFALSFRQGQRSPLVTPPTCGPYTVKAALYPWSNPSVPVEDESSFKITQGPEGQGCPNGTPPFHPGLEAGTINNAAGTYSPFYTHITRKDSEQEITRFSIKLPTGLLAKLKGVSECSDAAVAAAKGREHEGGATEEEGSPSCPANSEVGSTKVGTGVGGVLAYAGGKLYLAGPYHGSPISLVSVNYAKVGPFDLGTVVVRFALDVDHETAEVSVDGANSDPIPHIVDGIPIHLRDIRAYVDRPSFTLNPTSCAKKSTAATILGSGANFASSSDDVPVTVSSPFQAADCASLGFAPKLALNLVGKKTHRGALPAFKAVLTYPKYGAYANIAAAQVTLPESEYLEQGHLKDVCTRKVFETGNTPGENCPAKSIYGHARATTPLLDAPLEGPVYLRTGYGTKLPELAAALNGPQISITLAGKIDSVHKKGTEGSRIRNTFSVVPDAPVEKFVLELKGGKKGLLVNSTDVCKGTHKALAAFTGQNGKLDEYEPALKAQCGKSGGKKKNKKSGKKAGH
jgi:hypothetical protein